jgi:hypothetical protein
MYHLRQSRETALAIPVIERKWYIERFVQQKEKENQAMEAERRKAKSRR